MSKIILAPYSTRLHSGGPNPKNPPEGFWPQVVSNLNALGHEVIQIGGIGEERIEGVSQHFTSWPLKALRYLIEDADTFISVESWLPHFVIVEKLNKRGVVIFSLSDPLVWGHPQNINLLKDRKYVREHQFQDWLTPAYNADAFVSPDEVVESVKEILSSHQNSVLSALGMSPFVQSGSKANNDRRLEEIDLLQRVGRVLRAIRELAEQRREKDASESDLSIGKQIIALCMEGEAAQRELSCVAEESGKSTHGSGI